MSDSADITILIASFNRSKQILPIINYYLEFGFHVRVAYDSDQPILINHPNLKLHHSTSSYASRCEFLSTGIETRYAILVTDDDLFIAEAIVRMRHLLEESNYVSVFGQVVGSWFNNGKIQVSPAYLPFESYSNNAIDPFVRVAFQYSNLGITPISMYRLTYSEILSNMLRLFGKLGFVSTPYIYENSAEILINYAGISFRTSDLYWIRNWEGGSISDSNWNRSLSFLDWFNHSDYIDERVEWLSIMSAFCPDLDLRDVCSILEARWKDGNTVRMVSSELFANLVKFKRRFHDYFRHKFTNFYSPQNLHRKVDWPHNPNSLLLLVRTMYSD